MDKIKKYKDKVIKIFTEKNNKSVYFIFLLGALGILLITLSDLFPEKSNENGNPDTENRFESYNQEEILENRIEEIISKISGAGKTSVMVTFDSSKEYFYAKDSSEDSNPEEKKREYEFVVIEDNDGEKPIVIKSEEAKIRGVLVICEGGDNPSVREKIIEALCALLDIPSNCVSVAKMA